MIYRNIDGELETEDTKVILQRYTIQELKEKKRMNNYLIDQLQITKAEIQLLIDEAKKLGIE